MKLTIMPLSSEWPFQDIVDNFRKDKALWQEVTAEVYNDMLGAVPPVFMGHGGFMNGEPYSQGTDSTGQSAATYYSFVEYEGKCYGKLCFIHDFPRDVAMLKAYIESLKGN